MAKKAASSKAKAEPKPKADKPKAQEIVIHFLVDGLTAMGKVWYRGEELRVVEGSKDYERVEAFIHMTKAEQWDKWGEEKFAPGPWPGVPADWDEEKYLASLDPDDLEAVKKMEKKKQRAALAGGKP